MRTTPSCLLPLVIVSALFAAGCGEDRPDRVQVSGQVLIDGQPLTCGFVRIMPENARPSTGAIGPDGRFKLTTFGCISRNCIDHNLRWSDLFYGLQPGVNLLRSSVVNSPAIE